MESIWEQTVEIAKRKPLPTNLEAENVVIGGGMAGILTAYFLQQQGMQTIVLEASRIGSGQTQNTTAKITSQHSLIYDSLLSHRGKELAKQYASANQEAIQQYQKIITERGISCDFEELPAFLYSTKDSDTLKKETQAACELGIEAEYTKDTKLPFQVKGAMRFANQAQFHPLKFLKEIADELVIYEDTKVLDVKENQVITDRGMIHAKNIIFTTHYPFLNTPGYYFMRMHQERSYVLALEHAMNLDGMYLGIDSDGMSFRNAENKLLLGGGSHRTGASICESNYQKLREQAKMYWPKSKEITHWSAQDCIPMDNVPYIGLYSQATPNWYVATGFNKWGMTSSMVAARIISGRIAGKVTPYEDAFLPQRFSLAASAKHLLEDGKESVKGITKELFSGAKKAMEELPKGQGGIVEYEGEKVGVYKTSEGELFAVSTRCPHLGCQLEWNQDERSWDCPCHGSRFDYKGNLIDNPAQENLMVISHR